MDWKLRRTVLFLTLGYWVGLAMLSYGYSLPLPLMPLAYPVYHCGRLFRTGRLWYLGALVSIALACIPSLLVKVLGLIAFHVFFSVGNLHLACKMRNIQAALPLGLGLLAGPLSYPLGLWLLIAGLLGEGFGLLLLGLSAPRAAAPTN